MEEYQIIIYQSCIVDSKYRYNIKANSLEEAKEKAKQIVKDGITCDQKDGFDYFEWGEDSSLNPNGDTQVSFLNTETDDIIIKNKDL